LFFFAFLGILARIHYSANLERMMVDIKKSSVTNSRPARKADRGKAENVQTALYQIADAASAVTDMQEFYAALHRIVGKLMYAKNFYVSLYDPATHVISAPYFADEAGDTAPPPAKLEEFSKTLRAHVLRTGRTLHVSGKEIEAGRRRGKFTPMGTPAEDWLGVPLKAGGQVIGMLTLQSYKKGFGYEEQDVRVLEFVAQHIAVALTRARAIDETRQRNAELQIINSVQAALAAKLDIQDIYESVGDKIREIFHNADVSLRILDTKANLLHYQYVVENGRRIHIDPFPIPERGFGPHVLRTRESLMINENMPQEIVKYGSGIVPGTLSSKSLIMVPLVSGNEARGLITLNDVVHEHAFNDSDVRLLETLANSMSVALENAHLFDETQRLLKETEQRAAELQIINSVQEGLASRLDMQAIYELVGEKIRNTFKAQVVSIDTYDRATQLLHSRYYFEGGRILPGTTYAFFGFRKHVIENRKPLVINSDMSHWMEEYNNPINLGAQPKSAIFVPMIVGDEAMGVISLQNNDQENAFSDADLRLLATLANSMSVALENARLWEQEKKFRKALQRELEIGREIQAGFLPEALPLVEGWEIAASLMSAREVAGDFYDAFELPDGTIGLVIADVCDKGVGAALFMTLFRSLIRVTSNLEFFEHAEGQNMPHSTPERLKRAMVLTNNYIAETHGDSGMFATLFFGILDPRTGKLTYINGGHEPPLIIQSGTTRETLYTTGPAVGAVMDCEFNLRETQLDGGDMFFAYTDGVPECKDPQGEFFGRERLLEIPHRFNGSAYELVKNIETDLRQYIASATQFDDITLLAVRRRNASLM